MMTVLLVLIGVILLGVALFAVSYFLRQRIMLPAGGVEYADSDSKPGEILEAKEIPLVGKPDYILKKNGEYIPVEVKTGNTPNTPYKNHLAQLFAYCLLVSDRFEKRPSYGIIRYPEKEVPLQYTETAEEGIKKTVEEIMKKKQSGSYRTKLAQVCKKCREGKHGDTL